LFSKIPNSGKIYYIKNGKEFSKEEVLKKWQKTSFVKNMKKDELKGWIFDILNCIESLDKKEFKLKEIYKFEKDLKILHPQNNNIKEKIRQQLQFLRNKNYLEFLEKGKYRLK
jgi:type II restriction enzyme